jgi:hypothetical protein
VRTINGYVTESSGAQTVTNPVQIKVKYVNDPEVAGGRMEEEIAVVWSGSGLPDISYTFPQADYIRWKTRSIDAQNELTNSRLYYLIPASGLGLQGTNFAQTEYGYDGAGRQNQLTSPTGTITFKVFNEMSWLIQTSVGTTLANLVPVEQLEYDGNEGGGDGNLTFRIVLVDSTSTNNRAVGYNYDWRDRQIQAQANDGTRTIITVNSFDNRDNIIQVNEYQNSVTSANLLNQAQTSFDALNRQYQTQRYGVNTASGGTLGPALVANRFYDPTGRIVRDEPDGEVGFNASLYDALGRRLVLYKAFGGTLEPSNPGDISTATVIEQWESTYDAASNLISAVNRQRFDDATGVGTLQNPSTEPEARVYYVARWNKRRPRSALSWPA